MAKQNIPAKKIYREKLRNSEFRLLPCFGGCSDNFSGTTEGLNGGDGGCLIPDANEWEEEQGIAKFRRAREEASFLRPFPSSRARIPLPLLTSERRLHTRKYLDNPHSQFPALQSHMSCITINAKGSIQSTQTLSKPVSHLYG